MSQTYTLRRGRTSFEQDDYLARLGEAGTEAEREALAARAILQAFDRYYSESRHIPEYAKRAFEERDPGTSLILSRRRLSIYGQSIGKMAEALTAVMPELALSEQPWRAIEAVCLPLIEGRYEADLAFAYIHSVRRQIHEGEWQPVAYSFSGADEAAAGPAAKVYLNFPGGPSVTAETVAEILKIPGFSRRYRDLEGDAAAVAARVNATLGLDGGNPHAVQVVQMASAGFYRNRGAYLLGRIVLQDSTLVPFVIALLNDEAGIYVDAVLNTETDTHNIFSSTLANFHVTDAHYHELSAFLYSIMPRRPLGLHYSTIGFNHVGKVAVMDELRAELSRPGETLGTAVGFRGTVAIGFSAPRSAYVLKVIRDKPTAQYKWGTFDGVEAVLKKYSRVHEINRTGSMLDNVIYYNLALHRDWFEPALLEELLSEAGANVSLRDEAVVFKHLIVQRRMVPLPVFLETATPAEAETAIVNLGHCIKNNAAANIFNKDLDGRNYGVSRHRKVYLFDYDALLPFTEVKIRTNTDRVDGEEDVPDWFFEDGFVFLPEEIEAGLRIPSRDLRRLFREVHGELTTVAYWQKMQDDLLSGQVPSISIYPEERRLMRDSRRGEVST